MFNFAFFARIANFFISNKIKNNQPNREALRGMGTLTGEELEPLAIATEDFDEAVRRVQPSAKREGGR